MAYPRAPQVNMSAAWTVTAPEMASAAAARRVFMSFLPNETIYPLPGAIEAVAQRAVVELMSWMHSRSLSASRPNRVYAYIRLGDIARVYKRKCFTDASD